MLLPEEQELTITAAWPPVEALNPGEIGAARWAMEKREASGWRTGTLPNVRFQFRPLVTGRGVVGVCGFVPADRDQAFARRRWITRSTSCSTRHPSRSTARCSSRNRSRRRRLVENEKLRSTLLASLSHDLRTPLATITGAATTLRRVRRFPGRGQAARPRRLHRGRERASRALHRQSPRHVADRGRRPEAEIGNG